MGFHDIRFPTNLSLGALGGPQRRTEIVALVNGFEERNSPWAHSRRHYNVGLAVRSLRDIEQVIAFFEARQGQLYAFRWKDWADYKSSLPDRPVAMLDQTIGVGDGIARQFQLYKTYVSGPSSYKRPIQKPVAGSVVAAVGGAARAVSADYGQGTITFATPPAMGAVITAGFEFDVPVRFDTDRLQISIQTIEAGEVPDIPLIEVRL